MPSRASAKKRKANKDMAGYFEVLAPAVTQSDEGVPKESECDGEVAECDEVRERLAEMRDRDGASIITYRQSWL